MKPRRPVQRQRPPFNSPPAGAAVGPVRSPPTRGAFSYTRLRMSAYANARALKAHLPEPRLPIPSDHQKIKTTRNVGRLPLVETSSVDSGRVYGRPGNTTVPVGCRTDSRRQTR